MYPNAAKSQLFSAFFYILALRALRHYNFRMKIIESLADISKKLKGCVLTIGNFDGVHLGHQEILAAAKTAAAENNAPLVAMTFDPHPVAVLYPEKAPKVLTPIKLKEHLLAKFDVEYLVVLKDSADLLNLSPQDSVGQFLMRTLKPAVVVEGADFNFGKARAGTVDTLKQLAKENGFDVIVAPDKIVKLATGQKIRVSSTTIRYMIESGHVIDAAAVLGRYYRLIGKIVPGRGKGKHLGFPTLNMEIPKQIIPAEGVYAGRVEIAEDFDKALEAKKNFNAVFSIGQARTFGPEHPLLVEAHLLTDDVPDSKDKWMAMEFIQHIRTQQKFASEQELIDQITMDCKTAEKILATESTEINE